MDQLLVLAAGAMLGVTVCTMAPRGSGRGVVLTLVAFVLCNAWTPSGPEVSPFAETALTASLGLVLAGSAVRRSVDPRNARTSAQTALVVVFSIWAVIVTALQFPSGANQQIQYAALSAGAFLTARNSSPEERRTFRRGLVALAALESLAGVVEALVGKAAVPWSVTASVYSSTNPFVGGVIDRVGGTVGHPIPLAALAALGIVLLLTHPGDLRPTVLRGLLIGVLSVGLFLSGTRSIAIGLAVCACFLVVSSNSRSRGFRLAAVFSGVSIGLAVTAGAVVEQVNALRASGSWENRAGSIGSVPDLIRDRPPLEALVGSGWGSQPSLFERGFFAQNGLEIVDNQFVSTLGTLGVIGCLLLVAQLISAWRNGDQATRGIVVLVVSAGMSFDYLVWISVAVLFAALLPAGRAPAGGPSTPDGRILRGHVPNGHVPHDQLHPTGAGASAPDSTTGQPARFHTLTIGTTP